MDNDSISFRSYFGGDFSIAFEFKTIDINLK